MESFRYGAATAQAQASALAGFVDAVAFIQSGGFFVSFMSGNSTRMAVGFVQNPGAAWTALARTYSGEPARKLVNGVLGTAHREGADSAKDGGSPT